MKIGKTKKVETVEPQPYIPAQPPVAPPPQREAPKSPPVKQPTKPIEEPVPA